MHKFTDEQIINKNKECDDKCATCKRPFSGWRELGALCDDCKYTPKIIQISAISGSQDAVETVFGLSDDNKVYWWDRSTQTWALHI